MTVAQALEKLSASVKPILTPRVITYCAHEEAIVREAYKDSEGNWTWALGVTNPSGHRVHPRYLDNPQSLEKCIEISIWLMGKSYMPTVIKAFEGVKMDEAKWAAALSFHWNTGAISFTNWVRMYKAGKVKQAREFLVTHYLNDGDLKARRDREAALFFDGVWPKNMDVTVFPVRKPSYQPDFARGKKVDLLKILEGEKLI